MVKRERVAKTKKPQTQNQQRTGKASSQSLPQRDADVEHILMLQRLIGNRATLDLLQRQDASGVESLEFAPMLVASEKFHRRARRLNRYFAGHLRRNGWPYLPELKQLWRSGNYKEFAEAVWNFQVNDMGIAAESKAADGILGPNTAKAMQPSSRDTAKSDEKTKTGSAKPEAPAPKTDAVKSGAPSPKTDAAKSYMPGAAGPGAGAVAAAPKQQAKTGGANHEAMAVADLRERYRQVQETLAQGFLEPGERIAFEQEEILVKEALIDRITADSIKMDLKAFNNIAVNVTTATGELQSITVRAAYFIHTEKGQKHVEKARQASQFAKIKKTLKDNDDVSLMKTGKGKQMDSGFAVEYGKGTPEDVRRVVQEAIRRGTIKDYAVSTNKLKASQSLDALNAATLKDVVQEWIYDNGVGVDCSGFVVQTQVRARQKVREELSSLGVGQGDLPAEISSRVRNAKSFRSETQVKRPADLRPGDAWVTPSGGHIRIVMDVRQKTVKGKEIIEFDTAESSGGSTSTRKGQVKKTKKTGGLDDWGKVTGSFHRL